MDNLKNLQKINSIKAEKPDQAEFNGLLKSAERMVHDAQNPSLSPESRFTLAYDAAHSLALAALRWHGYRSDKRFVVFQALAHTLGVPPAKWRFLDTCHGKRNGALYEGSYDFDEQLIHELIEIAKDLRTQVAALGPVDVEQGR